MSSWLACNGIFPKIPSLLSHFLYYFITFKWSLSDPTLITLISVVISGRENWKFLTPDGYYVGYQFHSTIKFPSLWSYPTVWPWSFTPCSTLCALYLLESAYQASLVLLTVKGLQVWSCLGNYHGIESLPFYYIAPRRFLQCYSPSKNKISQWVILNNYSP